MLCNKFFNVDQNNWFLHAWRLKLTSTIHIFFLTMLSHWTSGHLGSPAGRCLVVGRCPTQLFLHFASFHSCKRDTGLINLQMLHVPMKCKFVWYASITPYIMLIHIVGLCRFDIMKKCWKSKPADRPTFSELVTSIERLADNLTGYIIPMSELIEELN